MHSLRKINAPMILLYQRSSQPSKVLLIFGKLWTRPVISSSFFASILIDRWEQFYKSVYSPRLSAIFHLSSPFYPIFDYAITREELLMSLKKCKSSKAGASDDIGYKLLKKSPSNWLHYLLALYNKILYACNTPADWSKIIMCILHKKGNLTDPGNYHRIALINCTVKIFTQILCAQIQK